MRGPVAALLALGLAAGLARADAPVRLRYRAGPGCPDQRAFEALVRERVADLRLTADQGPEYAVSAEQTERGASGRLSLASGGQGALVREVTAERCDEVVEALALVLAMSLQAPAPAASAAPAASSAPAPPAPEAPAQRWRAGAQAAARAGVAPAWMAGAALFVERQGPDPSLRSPSVRLSMGFAASREIDAPPGTIRMRLLTGRLDACPLPLRPGPALSLWPCVGAEAGVLGARGGGVARPGSAVGVWAAMHGLARLRWSISPRWSLEAEGGLTAALTRHRFIFEQPPSEAARPSLLGASLAAGVALSIP